VRRQYPSRLKSVTLLLFFVLLLSYLILNVSAQASGTPTVKALPSTSSPKLDETLTVDITITDVENLYGLDVIFRWNTSILEVLSADHHLGVEADPIGVLHEIQPDAAIYIAEDNASQAIGEYHLVATSINPAASFNGSGTIATVTLKVIGVGHSELDLETELADRPPLGELPSNLIEHSDIDASVDSLPTETPPTPTPWTFYIVPLIVIMLTIVTIAFVLYRKSVKKNTNVSKP
jgi:hypothetical protein